MAHKEDVSKLRTIILLHFFFKYCILSAHILSTCFFNTLLGNSEIDRSTAKHGFVTCINISQQLTGKSKCVSKEK